MKYKQQQYMILIYETVANKPFFYEDVGTVLREKYGVNGAIMRKLVSDKVVTVVNRTHKRTNGQIKPMYKLTLLGIEIIKGNRQRAGRYG